MNKQLSRQTISRKGLNDFAPNHALILSDQDIVSHPHFVHCNEILLRLPQVLQIFPVSKSNWWEGVKRGKYPKGLKISGRMTAWKLSDIQKLIETLK